MSVYRQAADRMAKAASLCPEGDAVLGERGEKLGWIGWIYVIFPKKR